MKKYKCFYRILRINEITSFKEEVTKTIIIMAKNKTLAIKFCEYEVGIKPFKIKIMR